MERMHWTFQDYLNRPLWFDTIYPLKLEAEAEYEESQRPKDSK